MHIPGCQKIEACHIPVKKNQFSQMLILFVEERRLIKYLATLKKGAIRNAHPITKTRLYNFDPLEPHFYIVKLGFTGVYIIFLISAQNIDCGYSLEPPRRGGSNEYPQSMF